MKDKPLDKHVMSGEGCGEGQGFTEETSHALTQSIIPTFNMIGLTCFFAQGLMRIFGKDSFIRIPEITVGLALAVGLGSFIKSC